jgi:ferredoxin-type protein NapF
MTTFNSDKRRFFKRLANVSNDLRPPWAASEYNFVERCTCCDSCMTSCPESIIEKDKSLRPIINFQKGECTFCGECVVSCLTDALLKDPSTVNPWNAKVMLSDGCLAQHNTLCRSCSDICEFSAIVFPISARGISPPIINLDLCNGCGACVSVCPTNALNVQYLAEHDAEKYNSMKN